MGYAARVDAVMFDNSKSAVFPEQVSIDDVDEPAPDFVQHLSRRCGVDAGTAFELLCRLVREYEPLAAKRPSDGVSAALPLANLHARQMEHGAPCHAQAHEAC
jgi:hypothetical protein